MILTFLFSVVALTTEKNYAENSLGNELKGSVINSSFVETEVREGPWLYNTFFGNDTNLSHYKPSQSLLHHFIVYRGLNPLP